MTRMGPLGRNFLHWVVDPIALFTCVISLGQAESLKATGELVPFIEKDLLT